MRFNIKNDFTPEEEEEVKRENAWWCAAEPRFHDLWVDPQPRLACSLAHSEVDGSTLVPAARSARCAFDEDALSPSTCGSGARTGREY